MKEFRDESLPELIARQRKENVILDAIRQQQLVLLQNTFLSLATVIHSGANEYVKQNTISDYRSFIEHLVNNYGRYDAKEPTIAIKQEEIAETPEQRQEILNSYGRIVDQLCLFFYQAPSDPWEILTHIHTLHRFLTDRKPEYSITENILSLNFAKLLAAASEAKARQVTADSRELPRIKSIADVKGRRKNEDKTPVEEAFYQLTISKGTTLNRVVTDIWEKLKKQPSKSTIRRYLEENQKIMSFFKPDDKTGFFKYNV
jgi:hypothetical protein